MELKDLVITAGQDSTPANWNPLDLRGKLKHFKIQVQDFQGKPVRQKFSATLPGNRGVYTSDSILEIYALGTISEMVIHCPGFRSVLVENVHQDRIVTLSKGLAVRVQIPSGMAQIPGHEISVKFSPKSMDTSIVSDDTVPFDSAPQLAQSLSKNFGDDGIAELWLSAYGDYYVFLKLTAIKKNSRRSTNLNVPGATNEIHISEQAGTQIISLDITQDILDKTKERLASYDR